jgi:hypothetical protein
MEDSRREGIIDIIKREFIGPDPINRLGMVQENGEEILSSDPPRIRYAAGILFPQNVIKEEIDDSEKENFNEETTDLSDVLITDDEKSTGAIELMQEAEELITLSNAFKQSAISMTVSIKNEDKLFVNVAAGSYNTLTSTDPTTEKKVTKYYRNAIIWNNENKEIILPSRQSRIKKYAVNCDDRETSLKFDITYRYIDKKNNSVVYTFTLENSKKLYDEAIRDEDCYFQSEFELISSLGFSSLPDNPKLNINDDDYQSNQLLYRDVRNYAMGHGCATDWEENNGKVMKIFTTIFPSYEIKPIVPSRLEGISLDMYKMSDFGDFEGTIVELTQMCSMYLSWINNLKSQLSELEDKYFETADRHIKSCILCHKRMTDGVKLLKSNDNVRKAFQYMNRAMLLQQLHYNLPLQEWEDDGNDDIKLVRLYEKLPDINDKSTWYDENRVYGKWRPFQLAFILINLKSMVDKTSSERKLIDLIWFPTGGGKTEAYLGLSAYTIFIRKIASRDNDFGISILMRYTLRLLTAQQYERAASMICACDMIRKEKEAELGNKRITIGLWVGGDTSPNKMNNGDDSAVKIYESLYKGTTTENPFVILKCPWCGARMGVVNLKKSRNLLPGYHKIGGRNSTKIIFQCDNERCDFSKNDYNLPLQVVDEVIYDDPPTLLLGTVDKFATLPFRPEAQKLFGIYDGARKGSPDLIIQDELHLISGPLGSMVGHYETMINELCTDRSMNIVIRPKIIASTATISRAKEQCNSLYNCGKDNVVQFPPSGIDAGNSFFAEEDKAKLGRKYVGILAPATSSFAMTVIRLYASLLYAAKAINVEDESNRDPYFTNLGYFNSLRELGQTATWVSADIDEYLHTIYKRRYDDLDEHYKEKRRYIYRFEELTSRIRSDKIPMSLQNLGIRYTGSENEKRAVDICLATNMISVGVDVPRLGLMTVVGQPKTTSEYIQATSRVGRDASAPGVIFTIYNPGRPRDKSYYEQFKTYHSRIYCHVEPTSVTPFSAPLRERALHAVLIGLIRLLGTPDEYKDPKKIPSNDKVQELFGIIEERVSAIDEDELEATQDRLDEILREWKIQAPQKYHDFFADEEVPLMYPAGTMPNIDWDDRGIPTPLSMRSVDSSCEAKVLKVQYLAEE